MTLPGFEYPHQLQPGCWQARACRRALEDLEHDDLMDADDYDRRRAQRDGWISDTQGRY
jgi:hypothetical protein